MTRPTTKGALDERIAAAGLTPIAEKIEAGERLSREDGIALYGNPDILAVGVLADRVRTRKHGLRAYFIRNQHLNYSNICVNSCRFCAFSRKEGQEGAYRMDLDTIRRKLEERIDDPISEVHIVGGLDPDLPWDYYLEMLRTVREIRPGVHIQAFTCVEIAHLAETFGRSVRDTLVELRDAGLGSIPGGGAEVFSGRIRKELCPTKLGPRGWLEVAKEAHRLGIRSNSTMLYGHLETAEECVDHMIALREAQDETGGFLTFIPLAFHSDNTELEGLPPHHRLPGPARHRRLAADARQHRPRQELLDHGRHQDRPTHPALRRRRHRRHGRRGEDHPHGRRPHQRMPQRRRAAEIDPRGGLRTSGTRYVVQCH